MDIWTFRISLLNNQKKVSSPHPKKKISEVLFTLYKKWSFPFIFFQQMWPNPQETAVMVTFTEEIFNGKLRILCSVIKKKKSSLHKEDKSIPLQLFNWDKQLFVVSTWITLGMGICDFLLYYNVMTTLIKTLCLL